MQKRGAVCLPVYYSTKTQIYKRLNDNTGNNIPAGTAVLFGMSKYSATSQ